MQFHTLAGRKIADRGRRVGDLATLLEFLWQELPPREQTCSRVPGVTFLTRVTEVYLMIRVLSADYFSVKIPEVHFMVKYT